MKGCAGLLALGVLLSVPPGPALAQGADDESERCISLRRIDRTEVIDDRTVAFHLRGGEILLNELPRPCPRLDTVKRFSYRTSSTQLCAVDMITVIEYTAFGYRDGASCGLGQFTPIADDLLEILKGDEGEAEITVTEIEVEEEQNDEADDEQ